MEKLSEEDHSVINKILLGSSKLIATFDNSEEALLSHAKASDKLLSTLSIIRDSLHMEKDTYLRPYEFKSNLPASVKNTHNSTISDILRFLKQAKILESADPNDLKPSTGGRHEHQELSGPKKYYRITKFLDEVSNVLEKPNARRVLFDALVESGGLRKYIYHSTLIAIYQEKQNSPERVDDIDFATLRYKRAYSGSDIFEVAKGILDFQKLQELAVNMTTELLKRITPESDIVKHLYKIGSICYFG